VPDIRPAVHGYTRSYAESNVKWIQDILDPWRNMDLAGLELFIATDDVDTAETAILYCRTSGTK